MVMVRVRDREIAYRASEGTGRPVVLVHSNSTSSRSWRPLLSGPFGAAFRCLALDLPGHGESPPAANPADYALPGYAEVLAGFLTALDAEDAVLVGWSLGGHIALETAARSRTLTGLAIFGAPPVGSAELLSAAFRPNPATNLGFTPELSTEQAEQYARSFLAPGSDVPVAEFTGDIERTDSRARAGLAASLGEGRFIDEIAVLAELRIPLAILHGREDALVDLDYLNGLTAPTLWRGAVQVLDGVGHAPHVEAPDRFAALLTEFVHDLPGTGQPTTG
jgi:pimeloyl-ACP methyl ester carboxylesterase